MSPDDGTAEPPVVDDVAISVARYQLQLALTVVSRMRLPTSGGAEPGGRVGRLGRSRVV